MPSKRELQIRSQYRITVTFEYLANIYSNVPWYVSMKLYEQSVNEVLESENIECIYDLPFGRGFSLVKDKFEGKLKQWEEKHSVKM